MTADSDICGAECVDGSPCQHPAGSCPVPSHGSADTNPNHGRDPKLTRERQEQIAQDIEGGASIVAACRMAGIDRQTFYNWMDHGEKQTEGVYADFFDRIVRARGYGEEQYRSTALELAREEGDTAAVMAMLKQRYPETWGDVNRGEQSGGVTVNVGDADSHEIDPETLEVIDE